MVALVGSSSFEGERPFRVHDRASFAEAVGAAVGPADPRAKEAWESLAAEVGFQDYDALKARHMAEIRERQAA